MTREEAIGKWIYPAIATMWNEDKCKEILEALEPKTGHWERIQYDSNPNISNDRCSVCGHNAPKVETGCLMNRYWESYLSNYCPNCGAKMESEG